MSYCDCEEPASLTSIPAGKARCTPRKFAKLLFARDLSTNYFVGPSTNPIDEEASWSGLMDAVDDTLWVATPTIEMPEFPEAGILAEGENQDGAEIREGTSPQEFTCMLRNLTYLQQAAIRELACDDNLMVIFLDSDGNFWADLRAADTHAGFHVSDDTLVFSDPTSTIVGGKMIFKNKLSFFLQEGWAERLVRVSPESGFLPLTELVPTVA